MNALAAQQRATDLEVIVKQKDTEVDALHTAMNESELTAKQAIDSMMVWVIYFLTFFGLISDRFFRQRAQEKLRQDFDAQIERLKVNLFQQFWNSEC